MRKLFSYFVLLAAGLLISGNSWGAYSGTGTESDPYLVDNATDLKDAVTRGGYIKLESDIMVGETGQGTLSIKKSLTLNLNGHTLYNHGKGTNNLVTIAQAAGGTEELRVKIQNGTMYRTNSAKVTSSKQIITINDSYANVILEGVIVGGEEQDSYGSKLHYGISIGQNGVKSLTITDYDNGKTKIPSNIHMGDYTVGGIPCSVTCLSYGAKVENITNNSNAVIVIKMQSNTTEYEPIHIMNDITNNKEKGGEIHIQEGCVVPMDKIASWIEEGYIDESQYTYSSDASAWKHSTKIQPANYYLNYYLTIKAVNIVSVTKDSDTKNFYSLKSAINSIEAGETATITALKSFDIVGTHLNVTEGRHITLDLNGKSIKTSGYTDKGNDYFIWIEDGSLDIKNGIINCWTSTMGQAYESVIYLYGSSNKDAEDYSVLNVGEDVKFINTGDNEDLKCLIAIFGSQGSEDAYGVKVNFDGTAMKFDDPSDPEPGCMGFMTINGTATAHETDNYPHITIGEKAKIYAEKVGIYAAGYGNWTIENGATIVAGLSAIEIRAGELNVNGGKIVSTYVGSESESWGNGNGTTTVGAGIAVVQHTTQQSIAVTISGGDIDAIIPVKLANPQGNAGASINQVNVAINGGRYKATSAPFWSVTDNFAVSEGKFSHVPAYVVEGKTVVPNTDGDKDTYPWAIGEVNSTAVEPDNGKTNITWQTAEDWENDVVPSAQDKVEIKDNQNVVISGNSDKVAQAYSITIPTGSTLTVESGATLIVGRGGITNEGGETNINGLKVEPGAQVFVSPDANMNGLYGRVAFTPNVGKYDEIEAGWHNKPNRYQLMGVPTKRVPTITKNKDDGDGFKLNQWDVETGWMAATKSDFTPFKGFFFWNDVNVNDDNPDLVTYYFKGELFGNKPQTLVFTEHEGFHLFANSYLAEVDIMALIQGAENNVQKAVYVYDPEQEKFSDISYATYGKSGVPSAIQPMQGFYFLNQHDETTQAPMDYVSMVWSNAFKVEQEFVPNAPARQQSEQMTEVRVSLTDNIKGRNDGVYLMERDEVNTNANIRKMMNPATSVNVFVANESGNLSQMQSADLDGQELIITTNAAPTYTFSFEWVQGEEYYLNDIVTSASTCMSEGNTYTFTAQPNTTIEGRFFISRNNRGSVVTDMQPVKTHHAAEGIYTVMGQFMGKTAAWKSLPQGVYVVNGVKMVK